MSVWVLGLTGGIGCGKSAAAKKFEDLGIQQVDADLIAKNVVKSGKPALKAIIKKLGPDFIMDDGELNRSLLRRHIFSNPTEKIWLENLLHPIIRKEIDAELKKIKTPYAILNAALLVESDFLKSKVSRLLVIDLPEKLQIERTMLRDNETEAQVRSILASQSSRLNRLSQANEVINNEGDLSFLHEEIEKLHKFYLSISKELTR